ncbi:hypothetical protein [uncultured Psychroserpens sp.]|uniref:hypothetical protein n=1 Tax=uncultured Psychroserpens sp. TaxID=255436 RepID=UPI002615F299|nr:hypothetical protein [uncultured Psychroserpens sp.]
MIKFNKLYIYSFFLITVFCFLIGGVFQFFIGIPNIVFTYGVLSLFFLTYFIYIAVKRKLFLNKVIILHVLLISVILISGIVNKTNLVKTLIYLIFVLVPLGCYLFFKINNKEYYVAKLAISKLFLLIAIIQLPVLLIQNVGFDFFIGFNRSSQEIASFDFMFGTFFLKADHSLGFFLLFNIINVYKNNENFAITKYPRLVLVYLIITVFVAESNVTKLLLAFFIIYLIYNSFPKRIKIVGFFAALIILPIGFFQLRNIKAFEREVYFIEREYNPAKSLRNYERGIAKRPQVVITYVTSQPLRIIGEGPYSYFDVLKGKFTSTKHFSQLIWAYADLGIIGLILVVMLLYALAASLNLSKGTTNLIFVVILIYAFMTTIFSDLALMITFISLLQKRTKNT